MRRKLSVTGTLSTVAGTGVAGYSGDGGLATLARFNSTIGVAVDAFENIYVSDPYHHVIRMITNSTGIITRIAGSKSGHYGYSGDGGPATLALLSYPQGLAVDTSGNIYIADFYNLVIRKITKSTGIISTVAGNGTYGYSGDGRLATSATMGNPYAVAVDASGNIYVADGDNSAVRIITLSTGIITSMPGISTPIVDVAFDSLGNAFMTDFYHCSILMRKKSTGIITTVAGTGAYGYSGDGELATSSSLEELTFLAIGKSGTVYFTDENSYRVRSFSVPNTTTTSSATTKTSSAIPNYLSVGLYNPVWWISASLLLLMW